MYTPGYSWHNGSDGRGCFRSRPPIQGVELEQIQGLAPGYMALHGTTNSSNGTISTDVICEPTLFGT